MAAMVEWLRCATHIYKMLYSNLGILVHGMTLDKSFTAKLFRMTHSYRANTSVSTLDRSSANSAVCKKKKTIETGCK